MRIRKPDRAAAALVACVLAALPSWSSAAPQAAPAPSVLSEVDTTIRQRFYDPKLKGVDWTAAVAKASSELARATTPAERDAVYDRLLATLSDSHTFRVAPGRLPSGPWGTPGLRIGQDGGGYAVKGVVPGGSAEKAGLKVGDRVLAIDGRPYGAARVNFRDLYFALEGAPGSAVAVTWQRGTGAPRTDRLVRAPEEGGDGLVWRSARVIRRNGKAYGYAHLWGLSADTALAVVDMLLDRETGAQGRAGLEDWPKIEGFLLDVRGNVGGYDPGILPTFLRGQWDTADYFVFSRDAKRLVPPKYAPLPVVLLTNSGTASNAEALALKFRAHGIGSIVGETTAGMASGGASAVPLSDGSLLWFTERAIESLDGKSHEGRGVEPDVRAADRPAAAGGSEDAIVEAAVTAVAAARKPS